VVEVRTVAAIGPGDSCREHRDIKTYSSQQGSEEAVQLITKASAAAFDYLVKENFFGEQDRAAEVDVEVFEWDGEYVGAVEGAEGLS